MSAQQQQYAEPQAYFDGDKVPTAENLVTAARTELDRLRAGVKEADAVAASTTDWTERVRLEQHAKSLARELQAVEFNARLVLQGGGDGGGTQRRASQQAGGQQPSPGYVVSDDGGSYVFVQNTKKRAPRPVGTEQQYFAEPTPPPTITA